MDTKKAIMTTVLVLILGTAPAVAQLSLWPHEETLIVHADGGTVAWDAQIISPYPGVIMADIWSIVVFPTGGSFDPFMIVRNMPFNINLIVTIENAIFHVPPFAPPGDYLFTLHVGRYNTQNVYDQESYVFTKLEGGDSMITRAGWSGDMTPRIRD
jgi:hypothetical protein